MGASLVLVGERLGMAAPGVAFTAGSQTLTGLAASSVSVATFVVGLALLLAVGGRVWRARDRTVDVRLSCAALVALVLVTSKVFSPQFLVWLVPLALVVDVRSWAWLAAMLAAACVLTGLIYPSRYEELVAFEGEPVALLVARNALLVVVAWLLVALLLRRLREVSAGDVAPVPEVEPTVRPAG